jgi:hypothetical protein
MGKKADSRLTKLAKRDAIDLREMITYMESFPPSTFRKAIIGYLKRQLESINCTGPMISFNMDKSEFILFQEYIALTLKEKDLLKEGKFEQAKKEDGERDSIPEAQKQVFIPTKTL